MRLNKTLGMAIVLTVALGIYIVLLAWRGVELLTSGNTVAVLIGVGVMAIGLIGVWVVATTWRAGLQVQRLVRRLAGDGGLPDVSDLPRMPSGRVDRKAADAWFDERRSELEDAPDDWRAWFRLAYAYDIAGDRPRARQAMRRAVDLEAASR